MLRKTKGDFGIEDMIKKANEIRYNCGAQRMREAIEHLKLLGID